LEDRFVHHDPETSVLEAIGAEVIEAGTNLGEADILALCKEADGITVNLVPMDRNVIAGLNKCRVIARYGVGYDKESDFLSIHAPLNDKTRHLIGKGQLALMKREAILVNTSRGGVVDTAALCDALKRGVIRGAGLDVHEQEPLPANSPLLELDTVVLSDHIGWYSEESQIELQTKAAQGVADVLTGKTPRSVVNQEVLKRSQSERGTPGGSPPRAAEGGGQ
jgi:D-3-phosphoglycerate dehydrogenase